MRTRLQSRFVWMARLEHNACENLEHNACENGAWQETHTMTTLSPSRYEESPGSGPHPLDNPPGAEVAVRKYLPRFS